MTSIADIPGHTRREVVQHMLDIGYKRIGFGQCTTAMHRPGDNFVIKVGDVTCDARRNGGAFFEEWCHSDEEAQTNPHFPRVYEYENRGDIFLSKAEYLNPGSSVGLTYNQISSSSAPADSLVKGGDKAVSDSEVEALRKRFPELFRAALMVHRTFGNEYMGDLHNGNMMYRHNWDGSYTEVINDPLYLSAQFL